MEKDRYENKNNPMEYWNTGLKEKSEATLLSMKGKQR
jgi:hypothetical protein